MNRKKILLHVCCAPCATASIKRLQKTGYDVVLFFSNSNIYPREEYDKRLSEAKKLAKILELSLYEDRYNHEEWLQTIRGLETCPEQGKRCEKCFEYTLGRTAQQADELGIPAFTTTLTISPHKVSKILFKLGQQFEKFMVFDFKKQGGFLDSMRLSKEYDLYRQSYCGCEFSLRQGKNNQQG
jgi:hypothetical protein